MKRTTVMLPDSLKSDAEILAREDRVSLSFLIRDALTSRIEQARIPKATRRPFVATKVEKKVAPAKVPDGMEADRYVEML